MVPGWFFMVFHGFSWFFMVFHGFSWFFFFLVVVMGVDQFYSSPAPAPSPPFLLRRLICAYFTTFFFDARNPSTIILCVLITPSDFISVFTIFDSGVYAFACNTAVICP